MLAWKLENDVNNFVQQSLESLNLRKLQDFNEESAMSDYMKEALRGAAKTKNKTNFGKPDFHCEKYAVPVIIENKLNLKKFIAQTKNEIKFDEKSISDYAVNGALYYARQMIASEKYNDVIAVGVAGDNAENVQIEIYYVYGSNENAFKKMPNSTFDFLGSEKAFKQFLEEARLTEAEKHRILIDSLDKLQKHAKVLNKLMHNHNITAPQRVLYVSGMLLAMQDIVNKDGKHIQDGLIPDDLKGLQTDSRRDGIVIINQIDEFLSMRGIENKKRELMLDSFAQISKDAQRDEPTALDKAVSTLLRDESSTNKQIFTYIYENIYSAIDGFGGHIDIMGELYSEFLKYALGDGKELGIVLTPPYVTKMMAEILNIKQDSRVMDLATGSAGFLISAMELMIADVENAFGKQTEKAKAKIEILKKEQLLGVELNAEMYTLATTNMILRGDGSSKIEKGNSFNRPESLYTDFNADRLLLNPPFSYTENGMPFLAFGLEKMQKGGLGAIIIQDSAGSGQAVATNQAMLKKHTLIASIKMPTDLFQPMAGVQTSIYIFEAHKPHDFDVAVKFIDFRNDGYKRTKRDLQEIDNPEQRYHEIVKIYKAGKSAKVDTSLWNLDEIYVEDLITSSGADWNFDQHKKVDTKPTLADFKKTVSDYLAWEVSQILKKNAPLDPK
ncbi:TPA: class I SAM-dependent DNA methyltransferase [Mannheimia haemolytica]